MVLVVLDGGGSGPSAEDDRATWRSVSALRSDQTLWAPVCFDTSGSWDSCAGALALMGSAP